MADKDDIAEIDDLIDAEMDKGEEVEDSAVQPEGEAPEAEAGTVEDETPEIPEDLQPFDAWKPEAKQAWESLVANEEYHDLLRQLRSAQIEPDYQYRTQLEQERADLRNRAQVADQVEQLAKQYNDVVQGQNPLGVASQLFYYAQQLARDPQATIQRLAKDYNVDLKRTVEDEPYIDEYTQKIQERLEAQERRWQEHQMQQQQAQQNQMIESAKAFEFETDAEGNLLHPHVPQVANQMLALMQAGQAQNWKDAYDAACWMNPEVRESLLKAQGESKKQQRTEQAQKAKAAASAQPKRSKSAKSQPPGVEDLDDALSRAEKELAA